ncbi:RNA methyltransferase, partial [Devosia psychrophila]
MAAQIGSGKGVGLLFGREKWGLRNEEVALADCIVTLPVEPALASLNIAQAVMLMAYAGRRQSDAGVNLPFAGGSAEGRAPGGMSG